MKNYTVNVRRDGDCYVAEVVELPCCHTFGSTWAEVCSRAREAISLWVEVEVQASDIEMVRVD